MSLRQRVNDELKQAMKAADKLKVSTLRLVNAAIKERDIENRTAGPDSGVGEAQILEVLNKMIKQRQDSLAAYEQAGRQDLAERERGEIAIICSFMPEMVGEAETAARSRSSAPSGPKWWARLRPRRPSPRRSRQPAPGASGTWAR